jgi:hypothetical protein
MRSFSRDPNVSDDPLDIGHDPKLPELELDKNCQPFSKTTGGLVAFDGTVAGGLSVTLIAAVPSSPTWLVAEMLTVYSPGSVASEAARKT